MGKAETPAEPISGLIGLHGERRFMSLAKSTPPAVPSAKAARPMTMMPSVAGCRNFVASNCMPTPSPSRMVAVFMISFCRPRESRSATPHSRMKLPSASDPIRGTAAGRKTMQTSSISTGKSSRSRCVTGRSWRMRISRSRRVVSSRMIGGWISGTSAM